MGLFDFLKKKEVPITEDIIEKTTIEEINFKEVYLKNSEEYVTGNIKEDGKNLVIKFMMSKDYKEVDISGPYFISFINKEINLDPNKVVPSINFYPCMDIPNTILLSNSLKKPKGLKIYKLNNCMAEYLLEYYKESSKMVVYNYKSLSAPDVYYQFFAEIPKELIGTEIENKTLDVLKQIITTYTEYWEE